MNTGVVELKLRAPGTSLGWECCGRIGTLPGGLVAVGPGLAVTVHLSMRPSFILVMFGIVPYVIADEDETG